MPRIIGIDIGGTKSAVVRADLTGQLQRAETFPTTNVTGTLERIMETIAALGPGESPLFGIACGSPMDAHAGVILSPPSLPDWVEVPITRLVTERFGGQAWLMNDANAGALAEWRFGAGQGCRNLIFLTHGTGFGAGLVLDGRLYEGATGDAGEIGHVRLEDEGPVGYHKAGSAEGFCSGSGLARWAALRRLPFKSAQEIGQAAEAGNAEALALLADSGRYLGRALALLIDLFNPDVIVLGSLYQRIGQFLEAEMRRALAQEALPGSLAACRIVPSELGEQIGNYAAVVVAMHGAGMLQK